jgi:hypothetical protein
MATITSFKKNLRIVRALSSFAQKLSAATVNHDSSSVLYTAIGVASVSYALLRVARYKFTDTNSVKLRSVLDSATETLATDCVVNCVNPPDSTVSSNTVVAYYNTNTQNISGPFNVPTIDYSPIETPTTQFVMEPVEQKQHRRIRSKKVYVASVIAEVKVRFGTAKMTAANEKAVMRFASDIMRKHGVRHTVIRKYLPTIVSACFVPDKWELKGAALSACPAAIGRRAELAYYNALSGSVDC